MILSIFLVIFSVLIGGVVAFSLESRRQWWKKWRPMIISFGGAFLLGITVTEVFPLVFGGASHHSGWVSYMILLGFLIQIILETISGGIEHGHVHSHNDHTQRSRLNKALTVMIGLSLHAIIEGMPISGLHTGGHAHNSYVWGIFIHKFPAAFALMAFLLDSHIEKWKTWMFLVLFSLMTPLGTLLGSYLVEFYGMLEVYPLLLALVAGSFLHISTIVLFEFDDQEGHRFSFRRLALILAGLILAALI